jgi:pimeloyl-ACP methyl ester carboxylesterase
LEYLQVGGLSIRYSDAGSGEPALLIHGLGGSIESWRTPASWQRACG